MIRPSPGPRPLAALRRRQLPRIGLLSAILLVLLEIVGVVPAFARVIKIPSRLRGAVQRGRGPVPLSVPRLALRRADGGEEGRSRATGLGLFHVSEVNGALVVDTNPLHLMRRDDSDWHADHVEVTA